MTAPLPPFSDPDPTCPKCGNVGAYTRYTNPRGHGGIGRIDYQYPTGPRVEVEHLSRECNRCDYSWPEATVEPKETP